MASPWGLNLPLTNRLRGAGRCNARQTPLIITQPVALRFPQPFPHQKWATHCVDIIGYSGDAGYSEGPHLHYRVQRAGSNTLLCPTNEDGFDEGGWLLQ